MSIITAWNSEKDRINELGSIQFAKETNQQLVTFYSIDKWVIYEDIPEKVTGHKRGKRVKATESNINITQAEQEELWELPHHATQHFPGKLSLCIGCLLCYEIIMQLNYVLPKDRKGLLLVGNPM